MKSYLQCSFNGTETRNITLLFASDERDQTYRSAIQTMVHDLGHTTAQRIQLLVVRVESENESETVYPKARHPTGDLRSFDSIGRIKGTDANRVRPRLANYSRSFDSTRPKMSSFLKSV
jgi:hypothetical protein